MSRHPCNSFKTNFTCRNPCQWGKSSECEPIPNGYTNEQLLQGIEDFISNTRIGVLRLATYIFVIFKRNGKIKNLDEAMFVAKQIFEIGSTPKAGIVRAHKYLSVPKQNRPPPKSTPDLDGRELTPQNVGQYVDGPIVNALQKFYTRFLRGEELKRQDIRMEIERKRKLEEQKRQKLLLQRQEQAKRRAEYVQRGLEMKRKRELDFQERQKQQQQQQQILRTKQLEAVARRQTPKPPIRPNPTPTRPKTPQPTKPNDIIDEDTAGPATNTTSRRSPRPQQLAIISNFDSDDESDDDYDDYDMNPMIGGKLKQKGQKKRPVRVPLGKSRVPTFPFFEPIANIPFDIRSAPCLRPDPIDEHQLPIVPRPHQSRLTKHIINHRGFIAAHSVGTGKTLLAVFCAECVMKHVPGVDGVVVLAPKSLIYNFEQTVRRYGGDLNRYFVTTYDTFSRYYNEDTGKYVNGGRTIDMRSQMLIVDEAHNLRTRVVISKQGHVKAGTRAKSIMNAASHAKRVLLLTATPLYNNPADICNLVAMVRGDKFAIKENELKALTGLCDLGDCALLKRYCGNMISFESQDRSGNDYPSMTYVDVELKMDADQEREYNRIEESGFEQRRTSTFVDPFKFLAGVRMGSNSRQVTAKARFIGNTITSVPPGPNGRWRKSVVFSSFLEYGLNIILRELTERYNLTVLYITGETPGPEREDRMTRFNNDEADVMLISKAGGEGLDMKGVRKMFLYEPSWNNATKEQAEGRANRYKSHVHLPPDEQNVTVYVLTSVRDPDLEREDEHSKPTADSLLKMMGARKSVDINHFKSQLEMIQIPK